MSAPDTDLKRQKRRHRPVLIGIALVVLFAGTIFLLNMGYAIDEDGPLEDALDTEPGISATEPDG
jgi:hypothetical protein